MAGVSGRSCLLVCSFRKGGRLGHFTGRCTHHRRLGVCIVTSACPLLCTSEGFVGTNPHRFISVVCRYGTFVSGSFRNATFSVVFGGPIFMFGERQRGIGSHVRDLVALFKVGRYVLSGPRG